MNKELQQLFFQQIKTKLPPAISLADEVSDMLDISTDSAYRRIRGDKPLTMGELQQLALRYRISVDTLFSVNSETIVFNSYSHLINAENFDFQEYLNGILRDIKNISQYPEREIIYAAKDIPIFHHFNFPELSAFKVFVWMKTVLQSPALQNERFSLKMTDEKAVKTGKDILDVYVKIPTTEIWNGETINTTISQLEYYWESGLFKNKQDALLLTDQIEQLIAHIQKQAELGTKFIAGKKPEEGNENYQLYAMDIILADNTILVKTNDYSAVYLTHNVLNYLITHDDTFCEKSFSSIRNLIRKSTLISSISEKERYKFFMKMQDKITTIRQKIR